MYSLRCHQLLLACYYLVCTFEYSLVAIYYCLSTVHYVLSTMDYVILIVAFHDSLLTILVTPEVATIAHHASIMVGSC